MGLFSFLKKAGSKVLRDNAEDNAAKAEEAKKRKEEMLEDIVTSSGIDVENMDIDYDGDKITVYGQVDSQADRERIILMLGNVEGVGTVDDRLSVVTPEPEADFYEVQKGDSLSKIAKKYYGDPMKYMTIFEANQPMLKDPNLIYPGQVLRVPRIN